MNSDKLRDLALNIEFVKTWDHQIILLSRLKFFMEKYVRKYFSLYLVKNAFVCLEF
jgi:hypothetical protein